MMAAPRARRLQWRLKRRTFIRMGAVAGTGLGGMVALACGRGKSGEGKGASGFAVGTTATTGQGQPRRGGTLTVPMRVEPVHLDLAIAGLYAINTVWGQVYNGLLKFRTGADVDPLAVEIAPDLPVKMEQPDSTTLVFTLQKPVNYQNVPPVNGRSMTTEDIKYSLDRLVTPTDPNIRFTAAFESIDSVRVVDPTTVQIKLKRPDAALLNSLAGNSASVIARELVETDGDLRKRAVGTGPFILDVWERGSALKLVRNPQYWDEGKPYLDEIRLLIIPDPSTQQGQFTAGQLDLLTQIEDPLQAKDIRNRVPNARSEEWLSRALTWGWRFRTTVKLLSDPRVRQAIGAAYERQRAIDTVYGGAAKTSGVLPPSFGDLALPLDQLGPSYSSDLRKARELLAAAGVAEGQPVEIGATTAGHGKQSGDAAVFLRDNLRRVGLDARVNDAPYAEFAAKIYSNTFEIMRLGSSAPLDAADMYIGTYQYAQVGADALGNPNFDPELLGKIQKYRTILDNAERRQFGFDIQRLLADRAYYVMAEANIYTDFWKPRVKNYRPHSMWPVGWASRVFREVWVEG